MCYTTLDVVLVDVIIIVIDSYCSSPCGYGIRLDNSHEIGFDYYYYYYDSILSNEIRVTGSVNSTRIVRTFAIDQDCGNDRTDFGTSGTFVAMYTSRDEYYAIEFFTCHTRRS